MKRIAFFLITFCFMFITVNAQEVTIERPPFIASSTTSIEVDKIIISDTATVLYINAFYRPNYWISIAKGSLLKDDKGQAYPIRDGVGIILGEEFYMPESGEAKFQLVFPPIPKSTQSIDFSEGEGIDNAFCIYGIQLNGLPKLNLPKNAVVHSIDKNAELPMPDIEYGKATLKGQILEFNKNILEKFPFYTTGSVTSLEEFEIQVDDNGTFTKEVDVLGPVPAFISIFGSLIDFYLVPGQTTELIINTRELSRQRSKLLHDTKPYGEAVYINGPLAALSQEINKNRINTELLRTLEELFDLDINGYKKFILDKKSKIIEEINAAPISNAAKQVYFINVEISAIQMILNGEQLVKRATAMKDQMSREEMIEYVTKTKIDIPDDYYDIFEQAVILNSPQALYAKSYTNVNRLDKEKLANAWGTNRGVFFNTIDASTIFNGINVDYQPLTPESEVQLATLPDSYQAMIKSANEKLLIKIEEQKIKTGYVINEIPQVPNEKLFNAIIGKYKGKAILVDFWATWCGPCLIANKAMVPMKEELKDVVYLYLTGETSPMGTWRNMIPDIHGEHFRVSNDQWNYLMNYFNISGIPTYYIIDKEGNTSFKNLGFPGVDKMKSELLKASGATN